MDKLVSALSNFARLAINKIQPGLQVQSYRELSWFGKKEECPNYTCKSKKGKHPIVQFFEPPEIPEHCTRKKEELDLSGIAGEKYRTCGDAILIQVDKNLPEPGPQKFDLEQERLRKMEAHPSLKDLPPDPMPPYQSAEQRLLDLTDHKLHPLYLKMRSIPKRPKKKDPQIRPYVFKSGPFKSEDIPLRLKINKDLLESKNLCADLKRIDPPKEYLGRLIEMKLNQRPTLEIAKCPLHPKTTDPPIDPCDTKAPCKI